ncbi:MAG: hypothetical protein WCW31_00435 [Patescibacteria group bacterium]|jgi:hypothetical protein
MTSSTQQTVVLRSPRKVSASQSTDYEALRAHYINEELVAAKQREQGLKPLFATSNFFDD